LPALPDFCVDPGKDGGALVRMPLDQRNAGFGSAKNRLAAIRGRGVTGDQRFILRRLDHPGQAGLQ
jgi:hypothetical protein